ncbi:MAG: KEOPS complex kinase/ATPase Bud32 [Candidatus Woesearchaeota archaeon]
MARKIIGRGAEAIIYHDKDVVKERVKKGYRIQEIDNRLRRFRTNREAKVIGRLQRIGFPSPKLINNDEKQTLVMEYIPGEKVRDLLEKSDYHKISQEIGRKIAIVHNNGIIHGDLTTSNMIMHTEVYFIDFGLSFFSEKVEDKAVDLHLFKQALESKHYTICNECFNAALKAYEKDAKQSAEILKRLEIVEKRGRYKHKK